MYTDNMSIFSEIGVREGKDRIGEEFLYNLACCYSHAEHALEKLLARHGLSPVKMNALLLIKHVGKDRGLSQQDLARRMIVSAGNVTRLVDRLEKEQLIVRKQGPDRRVKWIVATPKASRLLDRVWPIYKKKVDEIASFISNDLPNGVRILNDFRVKLSKDIAKETT